jgi:hypothetical protein
MKKSCEIKLKKIVIKSSKNKFSKNVKKNRKKIAKIFKNYFGEKKISKKFWKKNSNKF